MIRKVIFPLKLKLIILISFLIIASISFYVLFAVDLFKKDKSAYIYENSLSFISSLQKQTENILNEQKRMLMLLSESTQNKDTIQKIFTYNPQLLHFSVYKIVSEQLINELSFSNKKVLQQWKLSENYFRHLDQKRPLSLSQIKSRSLFLENLTLPGELPQIVMAFFSPEENKVYASHFSPEMLETPFQSSKIYSAYIINNLGTYFLPPKGQSDNINKKADPLIIQNVLSAKIDQGVKEIEREHKLKFLASFSELNDYGLVLIAEIEQQKAFQAANFLIDRSLYFGLFVLSITVILGILFSNRLTAGIQKLSDATRALAAGNFNVKTKVNSRDEMGALSDSFNFMSQEILRYMDEMKEKVRLENELKVAQLVQSSFFPEKDLSLSGLDLSAYYTPATECGGDWWGHIPLEGKTLIFIADATGHGVPAAFLTAMAFCCVNNLKTMSTTNPELLSSPSKVLSFMNQAVCSLNSEILMTCFVGLYDHQTKKLFYSNASHNQPLLCPQKEQSEATKSNFHPLMGALGPRLGHEAHAQFEDACIEIGTNDVIIFYTDGILECTNPAGKPWGQRNFLKSLASNIVSSTAKIRDCVIQEANQFYASQSPNDDITLVVTRMK